MGNVTSFYRGNGTREWRHLPSPCRCGKVLVISLLRFNRFPFLSKSTRCRCLRTTIFGRGSLSNSSAVCTRCFRSSKRHTLYRLFAVLIGRRTACCLASPNSTTRLAGGPSHKQL